MNDRGLLKLLRETPNGVFEMAGLLHNQGETIMLEALVAKTVGLALVLKLFKNNYTPLEGDTEAQYTEADFTGYASVALVAATWVTTAGAPSDVTYPQQVFTSSAGAQNQNVYGYYLVQSVTGKVVAGERFADGPYNIVNNGDLIKVTPKITQD